MPFGGFGLPAEGAAAALYLLEDVTEAEDVFVGLLEAAEGLGLARLMFEDAGRFFDDPPPPPAFGGEDRIEPSLPHDHMLAAAHPAVRQQLLDVQQPAVRPVDLVF